MLERFTWVMMIIQMAMVGGWDARTPISLETGVDLFEHAHRAKALEYIAAEDPGLTVLAPPCDPWSQIQNLNMSRPGVMNKLLQKGDVTKYCCSSVKMFTQIARQRARLYCLNNPADH